MPWNGTTLYLSNVGVDGTLANTRVIAGGAAESVFQPEWPPDGNEIIFVSDRTGWWNLYAYDLATETTRPLCPMEAEFGASQWNLGMSAYEFAGRGPIVCAYSRAGLGQLATLDSASGSLRAIETGFTGIRIGESRGRPPCIPRRRLGSADIHRHTRPAVRAISHRQTGERPA
jgi:hypothetical protein